MARDLQSTQLMAPLARVALVVAQLLQIRLLSAQVQLQMAVVLVAVLLMGAGQNGALPWAKWGSLRAVLLLMMVVVLLAIVVLQCGGALAAATLLLQPVSYYKLSRWVV
jgi:hypothetical protein